MVVAVVVAVACACKVVVAEVAVAVVEEPVKERDQEQVLGIGMAVRGVEGPPMMKELADPVLSRMERVYVVALDLDIESQMGYQVSGVYGCRVGLLDP